MARKTEVSQLIEAGAHLVRVGLDKRPLDKGWQKTPWDGTGDTPQVGCIPASLGAIVVDIDVPKHIKDAPARQAELIRRYDMVVANMGKPVAEIRTPSGGLHCWYRDVEDPWNVGNLKLTVGDLRGGKGQVVLWDVKRVLVMLSVPAPEPNRIHLMGRLALMLPTGCEIRLDGEPGDRNNALNKTVFQAVKTLADPEPAIAKARQYALDKGLPEAEVDRTIASARKGGLKAKAKPGRRRSKNAQEVIELLGGDTLDTALATALIRVRYNVRWLLPEISRAGGEWMPVDDMDEAHVRLLCGGLEWEDRVWRTLWLNTLRCKKVDPFLEYLRGLPPWDGRPRVDAWAPRCWTIAPGQYNARAAAWTGVHVFLGTVKRTLEPGAKLDVTPVIVGPQAAGKSWHLSSLFPEDLRGAFGDELRLTGDSKEMLEAMQGKALIEVSEMQGMTRAKLDALKAFLTRLADSARLSYRKNPDHAPRRCVFVGTVNDDGTGVLPEDGTGNRRWNVLRITGTGDHPSAVAADRDQYWAEALHRVEAGEDPSLPGDMVGEQRETNERFRMHDSFEDAIADIEDKAREATSLRGVHRHGIPPAVLWEWAGLLGKEERDAEGKVTERKGMLRTAAQVSKGDAMRFARTLKSRGWVRKHTEHGARWFPPADDLTT